MDIPAHKKRFVMIAALEVYGKALAAARKSNENAHCSTSDVDEKAIILEHLQAEYAEAGSQLTLEGTAIGEAMTREHYSDTDGTDLTADALDRWMRDTAGLFVPYAVIAEWVLEKRKLVAAWLRSIDGNVTDAVMDAKKDLPHADDSLTADKQHEIRDNAQRIGRTCAPDFIDVGWFTPPTPIEAAPLSTEDVDKWITTGPWGVIDYDADGVKPGTEWELVKRDGTDAAVILDRSEKVYTELESARQVAAMWNRDLAIGAGMATTEAALDEARTTAEPEPALHPA